MCMRIRNHKHQPVIETCLGKYHVTLIIRYTCSQSHKHTAKVYVHRTAFELIICPVYDCYINAVLHWLVN
jgi:hypothetical protein